MARFYGAVGYASGTMEVENGIWEDVITERNYFGDVVRNSVKVSAGQGVSDVLTLGNSIEIVADDYAGGNFHAIKYVRWAGVLWEVTEVVQEHPRLTLRLGGVYNGPTP